LVLYQGADICRGILSILTGITQDHNPRGGLALLDKVKQHLEFGGILRAQDDISAVPVLVIGTVADVSIHVHSSAKNSILQLKTPARVSAED